MRNGERYGVSGVHTTSIGIGYSQGKGEQRITNAVAGFIAERGELNVSGMVSQVGSVIDGGFTLNSKGYEHRDLEDIDKSRNIGINLTITPGVTEIYRNGRLTGESAGGFTVGTGVSYSEKDYVAKVKTTIGEATGVNVNGVRADLTDINRDVNNRVEIVRDREVNLVDVDLGTEYWATSYGREKFNNDVNQARNKVERVSEIMKAMIENENKDIGLYYRDRLDFEATRDDMERRGLTDGFIIDEMIGRALAELSAEQNIDDLQIISLDDPNIKEIVGAEAIAGRAYHTGEGKIIIVAENIEDFASAIGTITEEGRHIYHRNNNGLADSEDYASFYGEQFKNYYNRVAGDTPLVMIGSELGYNAGQLGNDWEDDAIKLKLNGNITVAGFTPDITGSISIIRNAEKKKIWVIYDIKGDVKLEKKLAGASLNLGVSYYPGVITVTELDEPRKKTPVTQALIDTVLTYGLKTFTGNPYAKATGGIYTGKGGNRTMEIGLTAGIGITAGKENPILPKELTLSVKDELTKVLENTMKEQLKLSKVVKIPGGRIIKEYSPKDMQYKILIIPPNPSRIWRSLVWN